MKRVGILKCDNFRSEIIKKHGDVEAQYIQMIKTGAPKDVEIEFIVYDVRKLEFPTENEFNLITGYIITGSRHDAYSEGDFF
jgi:hypothetical protein